MLEARRSVGTEDPRTRLPRYRCFLPDLAGSRLHPCASPHYPRAAARGERPASTKARSVAEREGFEPSAGCPAHDFQSCTFGHSVISPYGRCIIAPDNGSGEGGIRTRGEREPTPDFESGTFDLSDTSPVFSQGSKERCEEPRTLVVPNSTPYPNGMVQAWHSSELEHRLDRARLGATCAVYDAPHSGVQDAPHTHGAWFQRHVQG